MEAKMKRNLMYGAGAVLLTGLLIVAFMPKKEKAPISSVPSTPPAPASSGSARADQSGEGDFFEQEFGQTATVPDTTTPQMELRATTPAFSPMPTVATAVMTGK